jgi:uncharacterized protein DUF4154
MLYAQNRRGWLPRVLSVAERTATALLAFLIWMAPPAKLHSAPRAAPPGEYQVKAAFLYNFTKFVEWPRRSSRLSPTAFRIGILGEDPFGGAIEGITKEKTVGGRAILVRRLKNAEEARTCEVVFISVSEQSHLGLILGQLEGAGVLTVGDMEGFAKLGGVINFVMENQEVHFDINVDASERAGLRISSKLLSLARIVWSPGSGGRD